MNLSVNCSLSNISDSNILVVARGQMDRVLDSRSGLGSIPSAGHG